MVTKKEQNDAFILFVKIFKAHGATGHKRDILKRVDNIKLMMNNYLIFFPARKNKFSFKLSQTVVTVH